MERVNIKKFYAEAKENTPRQLNEGILVTNGERYISQLVDVEVQEAANILNLIADQLPSVVKEYFGTKGHTTILTLIKAPRFSIGNVFEIDDGKLIPVKRSLVEHRPVIKFTYPETDNEYQHRIDNIVTKRMNDIHSKQCDERTKKRHIQKLKDQLEELENGS